MARAQQKRLPGDTMLGFGIAYLLIALILGVATALGGGVPGLPVILLCIAGPIFMLIGYLQRIAAARDSERVRHD
ncbi:hypothetical protein NBM05_08455 [Rothia sp. AR01]|uniref:Uncharacterized protein n=1 Tax=Rothia santali TaxID=2949643 RepID=A0A9X2HFY4_9MICC|nr:hypothetical protein [Rothia santali]MCP3426032.1 hypothetical protein [Rothia santali]